MPYLQVLQNANSNLWTYIKMNAHFKSPWSKGSEVMMLPLFLSGENGAFK